MAQQREYLIEADEALVTIDRINGGKPFISESPYIGKERDMGDVLDEVEYATRVLRMNVATLAVEDITEQVAQAWLFQTDAEFGDTDKAPLFVLTSEAYRVWNATPEPRIDQHRQYSTMNHAQQGIGR